jgi:chromosome segregation protein
MHLKELKINGFKSFADPTKLHFDQGVTAVVGPNGCGKSNIADAIRWVLGEQSAKALRGGKMQDVIFEGTDKRKSLQVCEVSLLFTDCEEQLGLQFNEIEITRRVSRDAQSDYSINGKSCRLKDIQQIFMDTGVGRTSYSIMAQGQIDQILSNNPNERRAIFEEAAGITKYKSQRKEALSKLDAVQTNLNRLTDVVDEVKRQINSLRRQASKALRYKRLRFRLQHLDLAHSGRQFDILRVSIAEMEDRLLALGDSVARQKTELVRKEGEVEQKRAERSQANARLQEVQQAVFDLRTRREQAESKIRLSEARRSDLESRIEEAENEILSIESQLAEIAQRAEGNVQIKQEQLHLVGSSDEVFQLRNQELVSLQNQMTEAEQVLGREKHNLMRYENDVTRCRNQSSMIEVNVKSDQMRYASLDGEILDVEADSQAVAQNLESLQASLEQASQEATSAEAGVTTAQENVVATREASREAQKRIQDLDRSLAQHTARLRLLQQLQEKLEGFSDGAKAFLQGKLDHVLRASDRRPVTRNARVPQEYTKAIEVLLGAAVDAVAVQDPSTALSVIELLDQQKLGKACLQFPAGPADGAIGALPPFLKNAAAIVECEEEDGSRHPLKHLLAQSYIADSAGDFLGFWKENPAFSFTHVATAKGELIDSRGVIFGGFAKGQSSGILQRAAEIQELSADIAEQQKQLKALRAEADAQQERLSEAERSVETARNALMAVGQKRSNLQAEERSLSRSREEVTNRLRKLEGERGAIQQRQTRAQEELERIRTQLAEAEELLEGQRRKIAEAEMRLQELRDLREQKRESLSEVRLDLAEKRQRLEMLDRGLAEMDQRRRELEKTLESRRIEIRVTREQIGHLVREKETQSQEVAHAGEELGHLQERMEEVRVSFAQLESGIDLIEKELSQSRHQAEERQRELTKIEVKLAEQRSKIEFLQEEGRREYQVELSGIDWQVMLWHADDEPEGGHPLDLEDDEGGAPEKRKEGARRGPITAEGRAELEETDWDPIKTEIQALRSRIQSMGPVNLVAIEEYTELKQRFVFLTEQSDDLVKARDELVKAIEDINTRSQLQFQEIFEQIRKNFAYTFENLFGGGHADLQLLASEDVLDSGVEIVAQPPGLKLKSIFLLSGGQKTMTAVALLFAIYMVKPSPFCVLDELDAPLDEANIGRFTKMLRQFTSNSQFIIITHNKRTISEASAIFGVTMEEKGVSKVVSMKFNREKNEPETAALALAETSAT